MVKKMLVLKFIMEWSHSSLSSIGNLKKNQINKQKILEILGVMILIKSTQASLVTF